MPKETPKEETDWTVDTLKEYIMQRMADNQRVVDATFVAQEKAVAAALAATKEAVIKAETATEKRFESVNEFRAQLADQTSTLMPRQEYTVQHRALEDKLTDLTNRINTSSGQVEGSKITMGKIYAAIAAVGAILAMIVLLANNVF
jgi:hypothetical protein